MEPSQVEGAFLALCQESPEGITDKFFRKEHPLVSPSDLVKAINALLASGQLEMVKGINGELLYRAIAREETLILSQLDPDEKMVYLCIKASDNRGIWTKDLKTKTNLHQTVLNKVLKSLESGRRLIKSVRNVKNPTRKVYMLIGLNPSAELTGGPWFSETELDVEFINELCKPGKDAAILQVNFLNNRYPTLMDVHDFICNSGVTTTELGVDDVRMLLDRLIFDGDVEKIARVAQHTVRDSDNDDLDDDVFAYRALRTCDEEAESLEHFSLSSVPCATCPVYDLCSADDNGSINPGTCEYYKQWIANILAK